MLLALAALLSVVYFGMGFIAYHHVKPEERGQRDSNRLLALTLWWPFYGRIYDESVRRLRVWGMILLPIAAAAYLAYFLV
jgi:hypothetical protein